MGKDAVIMKCDIAKAFDSLNHDKIAETLRGHGTPEALIYCLIEELSFCEASFTLQEVTSHEDVMLMGGGNKGHRKPRASGIGTSTRLGRRLKWSFGLRVWVSLYLLTLGKLSLSLDCIGPTMCMFSETAQRNSKHVHNPYIQNCRLVS